MVKAAKAAYENYPTVVNALEESGITYKNEISEYARMDSKLQSAQRQIGGSSDTAQLGLSYYWSKLADNQQDDEETKILYEDFNVLAVIAQVSIDGCKRSYSVDPTEEIKRIRSQAVMKRKAGFPKFMKFTKEIKTVKNNVERPWKDIIADRKRIADRVDDSLVCPMNWLEEVLDEIKPMKKAQRIPIDEIFVWEKGNANSRKMGKVRKLVEEYNDWVTLNHNEIQMKKPETLAELTKRDNELTAAIRGMKLSYITMNHLVGSVLKADSYVSGQTNVAQVVKSSRKMLNALFRADRELFLRCFVRKS